MKYLTTLALCIPALLNGCAQSGQPVNPEYIPLKCPGSGYRINLKRDMSSITLYDKTIPLYSILSKDIAWNYEESMDFYTRMVVVKPDRQSQSYDIKIGSDTSFTCTATETPTVLVSNHSQLLDYLSPAAMKDNEERKKREMDNEKLKEEANKKSSTHVRRCEIYAKDMARKYGLKYRKVMSAIPMVDTASGYGGKKLSYCTIMLENQSRNIPVIFNALGNDVKYNATCTTGCEFVPF